MPQRFDIPRMTRFVSDILKECEMPQRHAQQFVELSLERKKRFHGMNFDDFGRCEIPFYLTPKILLNDYTWFPMMLKEMGLSSENLTVAMGKIYILTKRGGVPLTKELAKNMDKLFAAKHQWHRHYDYQEVIGKPEAFLARLGDVVSLNKKAVISINPGDILRKSLSPRHAAYTSCHNLKSGQYKQGPINYALDDTHLISYITGANDPVQKMHGRSMVVVSTDLGMIAMRKFYPSAEVFGPSRAQRVREEIHKMLCPGIIWRRSDSKIIEVKEANNGYLDDIAVATYREDFKDVQSSAELSRDIFCFNCAKIHQQKSQMCGKCGSVKL